MSAGGEFLDIEYQPLSKDNYLDLERSEFRVEEQITRGRKKVK
jgi:hypothetical protein